MCSPHQDSRMYDRSLRLGAPAHTRVASPTKGPLQTSGLPKATHSCLCQCTHKKDVSRRQLSANYVQPPPEETRSYRSALASPLLVPTAVVGVIGVTVTVQSRELRVQGGLVKGRVQGQVPQLIWGVPAGQNATFRCPSLLSDQSCSYGDGLTLLDSPQMRLKSHPRP